MREGGLKYFAAGPFQLGKHLIRRHLADQYKQGRAAIIETAGAGGNRQAWTSPSMNWPLTGTRTGTHRSVSVVFWSSSYQSILVLASSYPFKLVHGSEIA